VPIAAKGSSGAFLRHLRRALSPAQRAGTGSSLRLRSDIFRQAKEFIHCPNLIVIMPQVSSVLRGDFAKLGRRA
jgi:hypothetical protein